MKNLLVYVNPKKEFNEEYRLLAKIQIDNILGLGWKRDDVILATNFPYQYRGVKSTIISDDCYKGKSSKHLAVLFMINNNMIEPGEIYWVHDFDGYQLVPITKEELEMEDAVMALTDYGRMPLWSMGSVFFKYGARKIYHWIRNRTAKRNYREEHSLRSLTDENYRGINSKIKKLNSTYNFQRFNLRSNYPQAKKPIRNVHFKLVKDKIDFFIRGKNKLNLVLVPDRLIKIFKKHKVI